VSAVEVLRQARALLTPEGAWTQGADARDWAGESISPLAPNVICRCAMGAMLAVAGSYGVIKPAEALLRRAANVNPLVSLVDWNDERGRTQAEVLAAFDAAIAQAEQ
jgi:hypothetical protein